MSETAVADKPKAKVEYTEVEMTDGRKVKFPGNRQVDKTSVIDVEAGTAGVRFDFRNGETRLLMSESLTRETQLTALAHGLSQKVGDEWSGTKEIDDIVLTADEIINRLKGEGWAAPREAGDSMAGASIVIRAIIEARAADGVALTVDRVKEILNKKIETAKAKGEKLSRQDLYASFRNPTSKTGQIIKRMEEEKASKATKVNSDELLGDIA